jgi:signal transduction histidine kinase/CheY-like chemotaxis protein
MDFFKHLDLINQALRDTKDLEHIIEDVLEAVFSIYRCDRVWLFHPCDPDAATIRVFAEKNRPEYPGAFTTGEQIPISPEAAETIRKALHSSSPVVFGPGTENRIDDVTARFSVLSQIMMVLHPRMGKPWMFGMHQCSHARIWTQDERSLFKEISFRVVEGLNNLILLRDLKKSELKYRRFFTTVRNGWAYHQTIRNDQGLPVDYRLLEINNAFEVLTGFTAEHITGKRITEVLSLDKQTLQSWLRRFADVAKTGESVTFEGYLASTAICYTASVSRPDPDHLITVFENITERKEAIERFRTILDSIDALIYVADMETYELLFVNQYARDRLGEITGKICWQTLQSGQSGPCAFCTNDKLIDANGDPTGLYIWQWRNTVDHEWYECRDQAIRWLDGRIVRMEVATNITRRKEAEEQKKELEEKLRQAQKMEAIGTLAGGIAHDFNNILSAILGYTDLARQDCYHLPTVTKKLDNVIRAGHRAKDLVMQILAFSRKVDAERIPLNPGSIVKEAVKMLRPSLPSTIDIRLDVPAKTGTILADPTQFHQILMNLSTNAFHAMERAGGILSISLGETTLSESQVKNEPGVTAGKFVQLSVQDTGPGIDPGIRGKIFDPYFTTKEAGKGTGMGLSVVHGIVKSSSGFITIDSDSGNGTTVSVFLPVINMEPESENESEDPIPLGTERVLFVDDEEMLIRLNKTMLEALGYKVTTSSSSVDALRIFQENPAQFDLVITDQTMPEMTGSELAIRMRQIRPDLPIILCTGYSSIISRKKAKSIGIAAFAEKPLEKKEMARLIRKALE